MTTRLVTVLTISTILAFCNSHGDLNDVDDDGDDDNSNNDINNDNDVDDKIIRIIIVMMMMMIIVMVIITTLKDKEICDDLLTQSLRRELSPIRTLT